MTNLDGTSHASSDVPSTTTTSTNDARINEPDTSEYEANMIDTTTPSTLTDDFVCFPRSTGGLPPTQIVNRGGTININYNIYQAPCSALDKKVGLEADASAKHGEKVPIPSPTHTHSPSPIISPKKSARRNFATPSDITEEIADGLMSADQGRHITWSWEVSEVEKAKLKESTEFIFMDGSSRVKLAKELTKLAKSIRTGKWDDDLRRWVPIVVGPESSDTSIVQSGGLVSPSLARSESMETIDSLIVDHGPLEAGTAELSMTSFESSESFQGDSSRHGIDARSQSQGISTDRDDFEDDIDTSDTTSTGIIVRSRGVLISSSASNQGEPTLDLTVLKDMVLIPLAETRGEGKGSEISQPFAPSQDQKEPWVSSYHPSGHIERRGATEAPVDPVATNKSPGTEEADNTPQIKSILTATKTECSGTVKAGNKEVSFVLPGHDEPDTNDESQATSSHHQGISLKDKNKTRCSENMLTQTEGTSGAIQSSVAVTSTADTNEGVMANRPNLRPRRTKPGPNEVNPKANSEASNTKKTPTTGRKAGKPDTKPIVPQQAGQAKHKASKNTAQANAAGPKKVDKPGSNLPTLKTEKCVRDTDTPANSSASDTSARTAVLNMLARMAGSTTSGAQGHRDFSFLLGPTSESRKCRLCKNMFTDKTNVRLEGGGAPCSFHPGALPSPCQFEFL